MARQGTRGSTVFGIVLGAALVVSFISSRRGGAEGGRAAPSDSGSVVSEAREIGPFSGVSLAGSGDVTVTLGAEPSLTVRAPQRLLNDIRTEVEHDTLTIRFRRGTPVRGNRISYQVVTPTLERLELSGIGDVHADNVVGDEVTLTLSGSGGLSVGELHADELEVTLSGEGDMQLSGRADEQDVTVSGAGDYRACALSSQAAEVEVSGVGDALLWANKTLDAEVSGVGDVRYRGDPEVSADVTGVGSVARLKNCTVPSGRHF